jgi:hypothetical protein
MQTFSVHFVTKYYQKTSSVYFLKSISKSFQILVLKIFEFSKFPKIIGSNKEGSLQQFSNGKYQKLGPTRDHACACILVMAASIHAPITPRPPPATASPQPPS